MRAACAYLCTGLCLFHANTFVSMSGHAYIMTMLSSIHPSGHGLEFSETPRSSKALATGLSGRSGAMEQISLDLPLPAAWPAAGPANARHESKIK